MIKKMLLSFLFLFFLGASFQNLHADYLFKKGKLTNRKYAATMSVEEHAAAANNALEKQDWRDAIRHYEIIIHSFPDTSFANESYYYLGVAYFRMGDYDLANKRLIAYLEFSDESKFFEETIKMRLNIADKFANGAKKHIFGFESSPKLVSAMKDAVEIYKEIANVLPNHNLAAHALYAEGRLHLGEEEYKDANEAFQNLLLHFPKHELTPQTYVAIGDLYFEQLKKQIQNSHLLDLAEINIRKFNESFPMDDHIVEAEKKFDEMKNLYANQLMTTGSFYEKKKNPQASVVYYAYALKNFPNTEAAKEAKRRLQDLKKYVIKLGLSEDLLK